MVNDSSRSAAAAASNGGGLNCTQSQRRSFSPPWASVVRGDSEQNSSPTAAVMTPGPSSQPSEQDSAPDNSSIEIPGSEAHPETPDANGDSNAGQQRSSVWKKPSNVVVEPASVMGGAGSWPALGETTRPISKSSSDNPRPVSDGSAYPLQAPLVSQPPQRLANSTNSAQGNSTAHNSPTRQKSRNRNGGGGGSGGNSSGSGEPSQNTFNQPSPPMPPPFPVPYGMVPALMDTSVRGARPVSVGSPSHTGSEHFSPRNNNSRRGNYGSHRPRGDRQYHNNNYGGRRGQDRSDVHHHPPPPPPPPQFVRPPMGYMASPVPPGTVPFMGPPPMRIFPGGFDMASPFIYVSALPPESFRAMPLVPSPPPMLFPPANDNSLTSMIVKQIDFYFSDDNLVKDNYLRSNMDDQGWVPVGLIASFQRVQQLTRDIPVILESLTYSEVVEVQVDKLRRRDGWNKWVHSSASRNSDPSSTNAQSSSAPENALANSSQEVSLDNADCNANARDSQPEIPKGGISRGELTGQLGLTKGKDVAADETQSNRE